MSITGVPLLTRVRQGLAEVLGERGTNFAPK